jgi:hypothetical protein
MSRRLYLLMMVWVVLQSLWPASVVLIELWAVEAFCLRPVIILSLLRGYYVVYVGDASVSIILLANTVPMQNNICLVHRLEILAIQ